MDMEKKLMDTALDSTVTFQVKGKLSKDEKLFNYEVTVKSGFFRQEKKPDLTKNTIQELITDFNILPFLHNPVGPSITNTDTGERGYFINGHPLTPEEGAKLQHNVDFKTEAEEVFGIK